MQKKNQDITAKYWKEATAYVIRHSEDFDNPEWFAFEWRDETARKRWEAYFTWRLGRQPAGMTYLREGKINEFLVPCELPQDFDHGYQPRGQIGRAYP